jgi:hypothetical protein
MHHGVDIAGTTGNYFCVVTLKGEHHLKILGKAEEVPLSDVLAKFLDERKKSESNAIKQTRKTAKKNGVRRKALKELKRETVERIHAAYDVIIGLFVPDADGFAGTFYHYCGHPGLTSAIARARHAANLDTKNVEAAEMAQML